MKMPLLAACLLAFAPPCLAAVTDPPLLLRKPTVSRTEIAFAYGGDLWLVPRAGGDARRLTSDVGIETDPIFSPDGRTIAFTGEYDGNLDVFIVPTTGGVPTRLTSHPYADVAVGFTPDGTRVLFRSRRNGFANPRLFTVALEGGLPTELPLPQAEQGAFSPDGKRIAYVPFANHPDSPDFQRGLKRYRGGTASPIWIAQLSDSRIEKIPRTDSDDARPMWVGDTIYFLSDRQGPTTLYAFDTRTKRVEAVLPEGSGEIKAASAGPDAIVYEQLGGLYLLDLGTRKAHRVDIRVTADFPAVRPHWVDAAPEIQAAAVSPTGARALFEAHGEILTVPAERGDIRNLTRSPGVADRDPAWSPDGRWIAYFSDASGEYALHVVQQDGSGEVRKFDLGTPPSFFYAPHWSPDSKKVAFSDKRLNLWVLDLADGKPVRIDTNPFDGFGYDVAWSPDSRWIAYTRQLGSQLRAVFVHSLESKSSRQVTDGMSDAAFPSFDPSGKYLFFTASTDVGPVLASSMASYDVPVTRAAYLIVLRNDLPSPLAHRNDEERVKGASAAADALEDDCSEEGAKDGEKKGDDREPKKGKDSKEKDEPVTVRIDFADIDQRVLALPIPARNYTGMLSGAEHTLFLVEGPTVDDGRNLGRVVHAFDVCKRKLDKRLENVGAFVLTFDRKKALYEQLPEPDPLAAGGERPKGQWFLQAVDALGKKAEGRADAPKPLDLGSMQVYVEPRNEWKQIYREVWRIQRDFFYDPNLHGVDARALTAAFAPYLEGLVSRGDLTYLLADMLGEITAQHIYIGGGERPQPRRVPGGLLGADYAIENDRYRFARIYHGENWNPDLRAPLTEPGVQVQEGDYLLAVNGRPLTGRDEIFRFFEQTAGKSVRLSVGPDPGGKRARDVTVVPIADEESLRQRAWMDENRKKVDRLSGGRLAYIYLPDTAVGGYTNFNRYYFAQVHREGAIIDERYNRGGWVADYIVDWLNRPLLMMAMTREGDDVRLPFTLYGPKVMLINELAGSGGDALPWMFRRLGIGPLVGTRTWGGLIGIGGYPSLIDGGFVTAPRWALYSPTGEFDVENKGVAPDHEVELDPFVWRQGRDPQLEAAVDLALRELREHPPERLKRPTYPNYHKSATQAGGGRATQGGR